METTEDAGYWDMWKALTDDQRYSVAQDWTRSGRRKEWLAGKLIDLYEDNYQFYLQDLSERYIDDDR